MKNPTLSILASVAFTIAVLIGRIASASQPPEPPNLVLIIIVDQMRGDYLSIIQSRLGVGGFRRLLDRGVVYTNAHYRHGITVTAPGHATIVTGANPTEHGIINNLWYDPARRRDVYNTEDAKALLIGEPTKPLDGTSPRLLLATTIGDELVSASGGVSRVFSVAGKDRAAILPGGFLGKAYWYSAATGRYITSTYYSDQLPPWVEGWNAAKRADGYRSYVWDLAANRAGYRALAHDDRPVEVDILGLGRTFPHKFNSIKQNGFYEALRYTPISDRLTLEFAKALIEAEGVGQRGVTDMLAVSFSATDLIGHTFGADSLEAEDNLLQLDRTVAGLLDAVDKKVGLEHTLIVLTADHGMSDIPEVAAARGMPAGKVDQAGVAARINALFKDRTKGGGNLVLAFPGPDLYFDPETLAASGLSAADAETIAATDLMNLEGVARVYTRHDLMAGRIPKDLISQRMARGFHPMRSGNLLIVLKAGYALWPAGAPMAATHGTPYNSDTFVPLIFAGPNVSGADISRRVGPEDIAPTIAAYLRIKPPSGSTGDVLEEVLARGSSGK